MATNNVMKDQQKNNSSLFYTHVDPTTGKTDGWGILITEEPAAEEEGGVE